MRTCKPEAQTAFVAIIMHDQQPQQHNGLGAGGDWEVSTLRI